MYDGDLENTAFSPEDFTLGYYYINEIPEEAESTSEEKTEAPEQSNIEEKNNTSPILFVVSVAVLALAALTVILLAFRKKN